MSYENVPLDRLNSAIHVNHSAESYKCEILIENEIYSLDWNVLFFGKMFSALKPFDSI